MVMFGLEGSGFFLSIVFTLLLAGAVVFFMNGRLRGIQSVVIQQAGMLTNLIAEVDRQNLGMGGGASPQALDAARQLSAGEAEHAPIEIGTIKIAVSDDSCSEAYSSDSEDPSDSEQCPVALLPTGVAVLVEDEAAAADSACSAGPATGMKTITLSDVEDLSAINVESACPSVDITVVADLVPIMASNPNYLGAMKVGDLRLLADRLLAGNAMTKKTKKADIVAALQKAVAAHKSGATDLEKV